MRKVILEEAPGLTLADERVKQARTMLWGGWEGNWLAYNTGHDIHLPGSSRAPVPFLMYPQAENAQGRLDSRIRRPSSTGSRRRKSPSGGGRSRGAPLTLQSGRLRAVQTADSRGIGNGAARRILTCMKQVSLEIGERSELRLNALAHQWGVPPARVDLLCQSIDHDLMARLAVHAVTGSIVCKEDGVARFPARKPVRKDA